MNTVRAVCALGILLILAVPVSAQTTIDIHGGVDISRERGSSTLTLPPAGPPILTSNPIFPSRQTSTWFLGDGAAMLNDALADFGIVNRLAPLDAVLATTSFGSQTGGAFGVRVRRPFRSFALEASVDVLTAHAGTNDGFAAAAETARSSFESAFTALFSSGPFINTTVSATTAVSSGSGRRIALTGALILPFGRGQQFSPYLVAGGGVLSTIGSASSVTLTGHYRSTIHAGVPPVDVPIDESDQLRISFKERTSPVAVAGGGVTHALRGSLSVRVDARALIGANRSEVAIDATPSSVAGSPAGFIELFTFPSLQFSNNASTGRQSTLSGAGLHDATVVKAGGVAVRTIVSVGIVKRF